MRRLFSSGRAASDSSSWRDLMGATNPAQAESNTIRKLYGASVGENATHGSDAPETAAEEVKFFFPELS